MTGPANHEMRAGVDAPNRKLSGRTKVALILVAAVLLWGGGLWLRHSGLWERRELHRLCDAFAAAETRFPADPQAALDFVEKDHSIWWPHLGTTLAGLQGFDDTIKYMALLRFARMENGHTAWSCPALDRLWLGVVDRRATAEASPDDYVISVASNGRIELSATEMSLPELRRALHAIRQYGRTPVTAGQPSRGISLFREGWRQRMHPNADRVLDLLIEEDAGFGVCAKRGCSLDGRPPAPASPPP